MRVFVTGATGWVGSAIVKELIAAGHRVLGLARSDQGAEALVAAGALVASRFARGFGELAQRRRAVGRRDPHRLQSRLLEVRGQLRGGRARHRGARRRARRLRPSAARDVRTWRCSPLAARRPRRMCRPPTLPFPASRRRQRPRWWHAAYGHQPCGLPRRCMAHGDHGFVPILIAIAREKGVSAYIGDGLNRWPGVHRLDAARLYRLALERGAAGSRFHAVAEEGVPFKEIAEVIGRRLNIPVVSKSPDEAAEHFGWFAMFAGIDAPTSSARTRASSAGSRSSPDSSPISIIRPISQASGVPLTPDRINRSHRYRRAAKSDIPRQISQ